MNRSILLLLFFPLLGPASSFSQTTATDRLEQVKIQVTIPAYKCLNEAVDSTIDKEFRTALHENNQTLLQGEEHDPTMMEFRRVVERSQEYDAVRSSTISFFLMALLDNIYKNVDHFYDREELFFQTYDFLITVGDQEAKKLIDEYEADFKITFDTFYQTAKDTLAAMITLESRKGDSKSSFHKTYFNFTRSDPSFYFHDLYANLTLPLAKVIATNDPLYKAIIGRIQQRIDFVKAQKGLTIELPEDLRLQIEANSLEISEFQFVDGIADDSGTIFKGKFRRRFADNTGQNYVEKKGKGMREILGRQSIIVDSVALDLVALKQDGQWYYTLTPVSFSIDKQGFNLQEFDINLYKFDIANTIVHDGFLLKDQLSVNPNYFQQLYVLQKDIKENRIRIIIEYEKMLEQKKKK